MRYEQTLEPRRGFGEVALDRALDFVTPRVRKAALEAENTLSRLGVRHAFAGDLAVGAHGHVRETADVCFLVGEEAFEDHGGIVTFLPGVPIAVEGVRIDYLTAASLGPAVAACLDAPVMSDGLPVVSLEVLVLMKLVARRMQDQADVVQLLKKGADALLLRDWLAGNANDLLPLFERLVTQAESERS